MAGLGELVNAVAARRPLHARFIQDAYALLSEAEKAEADQYLPHLQANRPLDFLAESYETLLDDTFASQMHFMKEGRYQYSTYAEVAGSVYNDPVYMERYMAGLAISNFIWPNHVEIRRFFKNTFPWERRGSYLEVGPGHGLFMLLALQGSQLQPFVGVDISAGSLALTRDTVEKILPAALPRLQLVHADFLAEGSSGTNHQVLVMGEVLEHVEQPLPFLQRLRACAAPGAHIFVTTVVNTPAIDHITLFSSEAQVEKLLTDAGLSVQQKISIPYFGKTLKQCVSQDLPITVAYILTP